MKITFSEKEYYDLIDKFTREFRYKSVTDVVYREVENMVEAYGDFNRIAFVLNKDKDFDFCVTAVIEFDDKTRITGFSKKEVETNLILDWIYNILTSGQESSLLIGFNKNYLNIWGDK